MAQAFLAPEVLAPVGDWERLEMAVRFGADAVYLGGEQFGMRAAPANFTREQLAQAVEFAHRHGVKVHVACNTLPRCDEIRALPAFLADCRRMGVDALIIADLGVLALAREYAPGVRLHVSTQLGVVNDAAARQLHALGASRVVLARELGLEEIAQIRRNTPPDLELEAFVHGAMCMSVSGRCVISNYLTGRDANRGQCAQPCRWRYHLMEEKRPGEFFPVVEGEGGSYLLNAKDLCMIGHLDKLARAGVASFKIEGRAKSAYYVAVVTNAYRCAVDALAADPENYHCPPWLLEEVDKISHRAYSTGFYFGPPQQGQCDRDSGYVRRWEVAAIALEWRRGRLVCQQKNPLRCGQQLELLQPGCRPVPLLAQQLEDEAGGPIEAASHPHQVFSMACPQPVARGALLRRCVQGQ